MPGPPEHLTLANLAKIREAQHNRLENKRIAEQFPAPPPRVECGSCGMWYRPDLGHPNCPPHGQDCVRDRLAPRNYSEPPATKPDTAFIEHVELRNGRGETVAAWADVTERQCGKCDRWYPVTNGANGCPCRATKGAAMIANPTAPALHHVDDVDLGKGRARCHVCQYRYFIALGHPDCTGSFRPPLAPVPEFDNPADALTADDRAYLESLDYTHLAGPLPARGGRPYDLRSLWSWINAEHFRQVGAVIAGVYIVAIIVITLVSWIGGMAA